MNLISKFRSAIVRLRFYFWSLFRHRLEHQVLRYRKNGGELLRYQYHLRPTSLVFDLGAYRGDFSAELFRRFGCSIWLFEPLESHYSSLKQRFESYPSIRIFNFGLASTTRYVEMSIADESSSTYSKLKSNIWTERVLLECFSEFVAKNSIVSIDLMKVNIEGGEYDLLESMLENRLHEKVENFQIQFHNFIPECVNRRKQIQSQLEKTHTKIMDFPFVWEFWTKTKRL